MKEPVMVLKSARRRVAELAPLAQELNAGSDVFTQELKTLDADLGKLGLGVDVTLLNHALAEAWPVDGEEEGQPPDQLVSYLAFGRLRGSWRILVRTFSEWDDPNSASGPRERALQEEEPLVDASRELRIAAAEQIESLLELLSKETKEKVASLNNVIDRTPLPAGWEKLRLAIDQSRQVHVLKPDLKGDILCGAPAVSTNFAHTGIRPCTKCEELASAAVMNRPPSSRA